MKVRAVATACLGAFLVAGPGAAVRAEPAGHVTGIGGIFFKAKDPLALAAWYRDVLGLPLQPWGGAMLRYDAPGHPPVLTWSAFPDTTRYFAPSTGNFMINYAVDDMDAFFKRVADKGVTALKRVDDDPSGRFAWIVDPEGNKVELWEPKRTAAPAE
jgi:predicted enzyme related to lactoylglutathione lyase